MLPHILTAINLFLLFLRKICFTSIFTGYMVTRLLLVIVHGCYRVARYVLFCIMCILDDQEKSSVSSSVKAHSPKKKAKQSSKKPTKGLIWPVKYSMLYSNSN